jgi:hypothetical protein
MCCAGFSKIVDKGAVIASIDSNEEQIVHGIVDLTGDRPEVGPEAFKGWINYSFREIIPKFLTEKMALVYAKSYYRWHKRKFFD